MSMNNVHTFLMCFHEERIKLNLMWICLRRRRVSLPFV